MFLRDLKALFFVRDLVGDPTRHDGKQFPPGGTGGGHVEVRFRDGELMVGTVEGSTMHSPGFFLVPADPGSNNLRVYVLTAATRAVYPLPGLARPSAGLAAVPSGPRGAKAVVRPSLPDRLVSWLRR